MSSPRRRGPGQPSSRRALRRRARRTRRRSPAGSGCPRCGRGPRGRPQRSRQASRCGAAEPRRPRFGSLPPSDQEGSARSWPEGPDRPGQAGPAWRMQAIRSAPPLGSVAAPMPSDLPAHATPDVYPASLPRAQRTSNRRRRLTRGPATDHVPLWYTRPGAVLRWPRAASALAGSPEVVTRNAMSATALDGEAATSCTPPRRSTRPIRPPSPQTLSLRSRRLLRPRRMPRRPQPEVDPAAQAPAYPDAEPATSAPASSEVSATPGLPAAAPLVAATDRRTLGHGGARRPTRSTRLLRLLPPQTLEPAIAAPASSEAHAASATPEVDSDAPPVALVASRPRGCTSSQRSTRLPQAPVASDVDQAPSAPSAADLGPGGAAARSGQRAVNPGACSVGRRAAR